ncbi:urea ABC transporter permease [Pseudomonas aeruginosa VRFPA08]|nr:urea ABC transporter permease [Pseudomonas aeruginosa VRFPA08]
MKRRSLLKAFTLSASIASMGLSWSIQAAETIKVGILHSLSGTMAISETSLKDMALMTIDEINAKGGVNGKKLEAVVVDPASNWPLFAEKARQLLTQDKVAVVFGCWTSVSRKSVLPVFEELNGLLFYPVQYEGEELSPNVFYTGAAPNQQAIPAVEYLMSEDGGGARRFFLLGTDYVYPRTTNKILRAFLHSKGVDDKDIQEVYTPFGHSDYQTIVADIKKFAAGGKTAVVSTVNGDSNVPFYKELANQGLEATEVPVVAFSVGEEELRGIDTKPLVGNLAAWNYFESVSNPVNEKFVADWKAYAKAKNLPNYATAVTNDPHGSHLRRHPYVGAGRGKGRQHRGRQGSRGDGRAKLQGAIRLHAGHGQEQPPPAQAGDDRRDPGRRPVRSGLEDPRAASRATLEPVHPGQREKAGACAEEQLSSAVKNPAPLTRRSPERNGNAPVARRTAPSPFRERAGDRPYRTSPRNPSMPLALLTRPLQACVLVLAALLAVAAHAGPAQDFAAADNGGRAHLLEHWAATPDADRLAFLEALRHNRIALDSRQQPFLLGADQRFQAAEGDALPDGEPKPLRLNNRLRGLLNTALASHQLVANEVPLRQAAAQQLQKTAKAAQRPLLEARLRIESDAGVKEALGLALANLQLGDPDPALRLSAVRLLGESGDPLARTRLENLLDPAVEPEAGVRIAAATSLAQVKRRLLVGDLLGQAFSGLSLGSILLLAALGLAITYGLLGVINMAHGEMLMLGAYSTYVVQLLFQRLAPEWLALYPLLALPVAFCVSAAIGMALERTVIRHLYGRPLETLLATWGISLVLIQLVRMLFGAQNVEVANPAWLSGGIQVLPNLVLPWNRIVIIGFALFVLLLTWLLLNRTRLGLNVRAVTQNRNMAACCGVPTGRVDMLAFGLGSGIAGLGGVALSQVGNVGPDLGQGYIIDSFLVVVLGGVGQLAGSVLAAFGLGVANKILEPQIGAVLGKILILALIVLFIQKRPQGLFALKGRVID